jgi:hypothetical protein
VPSCRQAARSPGERGIQSWRHAPRRHRVANNDESHSRALGIDVWLRRGGSNRSDDSQRRQGPCVRHLARVCSRSTGWSPDWSDSVCQANASVPLHIQAAQARTESRSDDGGPLRAAYGVHGLSAAATGRFYGGSHGTFDNDFSTHHNMRRFQSAAARTAIAAAAILLFRISRRPLCGEGEAAATAGSSEFPLREPPGASAAFTAMAITPAQARCRQARIFRYVAFA